MKHHVQRQSASRTAKAGAAIGFKLISITAAVGMAYVATAQQAAHAQQAVIAFHLPAQPLGDALTALAIQSGRQVAYEELQVKGKRSVAVSGQMTVRQALDGVLAGTGLQVSSNGAVITVYDAKSSDGEKTLPAIVVSNNAATEDTGSYTTHTLGTATKLALSMRETPQSTTVITRQRMDDQAMVDINDVVASTPGLFVSSTGGPGRQSFAARGFSIDSTMEDGVAKTWQTFIPGGQPNLAMYDRVEVVRGATGMMQGAGNPSAAINMIRKRPTKEFKGAVTASVGSWDDYSASIDLSRALNASGSVRGRVVAFGQDSKSFRDVEESNNQLFYGIVEADLGPNTLLTIGAHNQKSHTNNAWGGMPMTRTGQHWNMPRSFFSAPDWQFLNTKTTTAFATLEHRFDNQWKARLSLAKSWSQNDILATNFYAEKDATTGMLTGTYYNSAWRAGRKSDYFNYDLYASGPLTVLGRQHELVVGNSRNIIDNTGQNFKGGVVARGVDIATWNPHSIPAPDFAWTDDSRDVTVQNSVYTTTRLNLADDWKLILGGRLDWYDYQNRTESGSYSIARNLTRYAGLIYDINDQHSVYASYTDIFKPQSNKDVSDNVLSPIVGKNYEIGIKGEYFGGTLNASAAIFQIDETNRSIGVTDSSLCPRPAEGCSSASGLVRSRGVELELQGALTPNWQIGAGYTFVDAKYVTDSNKAREGQPFDSRKPQHLFKVSSSYQLPGQLNQWRVSGNIYRQSDMYANGTTSGTTWRNEQKAYVLVDVGAGYKVNKHFDVQLNISNLFDKRYYKAISNDPAWWPMEAYGDPRKFKLTARYTF